MKRAALWRWRWSNLIEFVTTFLAALLLPGVVWFILWFARSE